MEYNLDSKGFKINFSAITNGLMPLANSVYYQLFKYDRLKINWFHIFFSQKEICGHNKQKVFENPVYTNV